MTNKSPIGEMNGLHSMLFKVFLLTYPFIGAALVSWGAWVTLNVSKFSAFIQYGSRFSRADAQKLEDRLHGDMHQTMSAHVRDLHK
jgi:hypothetical protein